jgi:metal-responsive CopG/Arc/MetJ family transcriptional regulator
MATNEKTSVKITVSMDKRMVKYIDYLARNKLNERTRAKVIESIVESWLMDNIEQEHERFERLSRMSKSWGDND